MAEDSFLHLARPLGPVSVGTAPTTAPLNVVIQPQAIFSVLDHSLRRNADQERVIGTLLGTRSEDGSEVEVRSAFAVGHSEAEDQVEVDMEYHKQMLALHLKANPREVLVGWYATASELNTFSALIQNFYSGQGDGTWPHPAVHLTVSTEAGKDLETRAYISAPVGVTAERAADSAAFIPVPYELRYAEADKSGLESIASAKDAEDRSATVTSDIDSLERAVEEVISMIDRVSRYVESVIDEETPASTAMGQFLLNALALAPKVEPADIERDFNNHIQDVLVVSYLANTVRTQMELSTRLATAQLTLGGGEGPATGEGQRNQRGGKGNNQGGRRQERTEEARA
ncbi:Eukaryotic translation initiation factor 3 subunit EifCf [Penicillium brevicompactum]|uniref:Eukaryotic translation initiation factor 3 subunit F n=1 Tax=Penicillium brevicompactum TaxID=5074 RepID=A0A9W9R428_PENBR|nr:Eukaryotic translation initiation factor 3 subunit EifCf [Penicillium brevicompactum]KAJ5334348.1 Eukaryotic translation initiation factor 3 subunit EifCf [Penicillium brevicompactum]KAJ5353357.1 Eukaryotic translation initiation factor 3 subunit EifCf [Penicillium brevicompactum]KAJ5363338.1 Eukaryotic translation initiation factor 3 subunit EifCf [Penicillium brevicompactum]